MNLWRLNMAVLVLAIIGVPVLLPLVESLTTPGGWAVWRESDRLGSLAVNSLAFVAGTLALCLPTGIAGAVLLYRTDLPLCRLFRLIVVMTLFVPLPLFTSAWQATLGSGGWLPQSWWNSYATAQGNGGTGAIVWTPWSHGLPAAIWVQAMAALPWVIVIVGEGLRWVERDLEEEGLLYASPWRVLLRVTLPRCRAAILAAALWVALLSLTEITVSDMMIVRTYAEEVYNQFVVGDAEGFARAVVVSLPAVAILVAGRAKPRAT